MEPFYVGKGQSTRWKPQYHQHRAQPMLVNKIRKIGARNILICFPFTNLTHKEALAFERMLISIHGRKDLGTGTLLNLTDGGDGIIGYTHSPETKAKMSATHKRLYAEGKVIPPSYWEGKHRSIEDRRKIAHTLKGTPSPMSGKKHSEAAKKRMSASAKVRAPMTEEVRQRLSDSTRRSWIKRRTKKV